MHTHVYARTRARAVRKVSVWPGHATFSRTHTHTRVPMRRGRHCVTVTTLSFYVTSRASDTRQKRRLLYMWERYVSTYERVPIRAGKGICPHCAASKKEVSHVILRVSGTLKSGFAGLSPSAITRKKVRRQAPRYYDRSPSSGTRLSIDCRRKKTCVLAHDWVMFRRRIICSINNNCTILEAIYKATCINISLIISILRRKQPSSVLTERNQPS